VYVAAAVVGLSAVLGSSALAFTTVNDLGVGYLVYLAITAFRTSQAGHRKPASTPSRFRPAFLQGVDVNLLNPRVSLFFWRSAVGRPGRGSPATQLLALGVVFLAIALTIDLLYAAVSGQIGTWLSRRPALARRQGRLTGAVYLDLAAVAVTASRHRTGN
jgi:threonine/homoserine/homoserine lactone efflux protein